jgi:predicted nucleic acid-binding Zn ribbon protein
MWIEDKFLEISEDSKKRARAFKVGWIIAYSMLLLGAFLIIWAFLV